MIYYSAYSTRLAADSMSAGEGVEGIAKIDVGNTLFTSLSTGVADYSATTTYTKGDKVMNQGALWIYISDVDGVGNAPPTLPNNLSNAYWEYVGSAGLFTWIAYANTTLFSSITNVSSAASFTSSSTISVSAGDTIVITGTNTGTGIISGYSSGTSYVVAASPAPTSTTFTLKNADGSTLTTTAGTLIGLSFYKIKDFTTNASTYNNISRQWMGIAINKTTNVESTATQDYSWSRFAGETAIYTNINRPTVSIPTDANGGNGVYTSSDDTRIYLFEGSATLIYDGVGTSPGTWKITSEDATNITKGTLSDGGDYARYGPASSMSQDTASIDYTAQGTTLGGVSFSGIKVTQTFVKVKGAVVDTTGPTWTGGTITFSPSTVTTNAVGNTFATLKANWSSIYAANADVSFYEIWISKVSGSDYTVFTIADNHISSPVETFSFAWNNLEPNTTYYVKVRGIDANGNSGAFSTEVSTTTAADSTAPATPTNFTASSALRTVFLSWTNPTANDLAAVQIYRLAVPSTISVAPTIPGTPIATVNARSAQPGGYSDSGISTYTPYYYWLKARDTSNNNSTETSITSSVLAATTVTTASGTLASPASIANKAIFTCTAHGMSVGTVLYITATTPFSGGTIGTISATGTVTSHTAGKVYVVSEKTANTFSLVDPSGNNVVVVTLTTNPISGGTYNVYNSSVVAPGAVGATEIIAGSIYADLIQGGTITGDKFKTNTSLPATITVGSTGVTIGQVEDVASSTPNLSGNIITNGNITEVGIDGRPRGIKAVYGGATTSNISYLDANKTILNVYSATDTGIGAGWPAFPITAGTTYTLSIRAKSNAAATSGFYFRMQEYDTALLPEGVTHVSNGAASSEAGVVEATRQITGFIENAAIATTWTDYTFTYTPTATAKWASPIVLNWTGMGLTELHIERIVAQSNATVGAPTGTYVGGTLAQTVETNAATGAQNPADRINAGTTKIGPGLIEVISGGATLDQTVGTWVYPSGTTIDGGKIQTNTILAQALNISARGVDPYSVEFYLDNSAGGTANPNRVNWASGGKIRYYNNAGTLTESTINTAGSATYSTLPVYLYWDVTVPNVITPTTTPADAYTANRIVLATYNGGAKLVVNRGGTSIHGDSIATGTVNANVLAVDTAIANRVFLGDNGNFTLDGNAYSNAVGSKKGLLTIKNPAGTIEVVKLGYITSTTPGIELRDASGNIILGTDTTTKGIYIADAVIGQANIKDLAVTTLKLDGESITREKLSQNSTMVITTLEPTTIQIASGTSTGTIGVFSDYYADGTSKIIAGNELGVTTANNSYSYSFYLRRRNKKTNGTKGKSVRLTAPTSSAYASYGTDNFLINTSAVTYTATVAYASDVTAPTTYTYRFYVNGELKQTTAATSSTTDTFAYTPPTTYSPEDIYIKVTVTDSDGDVSMDTYYIPTLLQDSGIYKAHMINPGCTLPTTAAGAVSYASTSNVIRVWNGNTQLTYDTAGGANTFDVAVTNDGGLTLGAVSGNGTTSYTIGNSSAMTSTASYTTYVITPRGPGGGAQPTITLRQQNIRSTTGSTATPIRPVTATSYVSAAAGTGLTYVTISIGGSTAFAAGDTIKVGTSATTTVTSVVRSGSYLMGSTINLATAITYSSGQTIYKGSPDLDTIDSWAGAYRENSNTALSRSNILSMRFIDSPEGGYYDYYIDYACASNLDVSSFNNIYLTMQKIHKV